MRGPGWDTPQWLLVCGAALSLSCQPAGGTQPAPNTAAQHNIAAQRTQPAAGAANTSTPAAASSSPRAAEPPPSTGPQLILVNETGRAITPYASYLVDIQGKQPTRQLWQSRRDCPKSDSAVPSEIAPNGGRLAWPVIAGAYPLDGCAAAERLPAGRYLLRLDSGLSGDIYAAAQLTLPQTKSVSLTFKPHSAYQGHCDRFATRVSLMVDGKPISVTSEHNVTRIEPLD